MKEVIKEQRIDEAISGSRQALEELMLEIQEPVFNLSLRMLGTIPDAEDASQEIFIKVMTNLSSFRRESSFSTWVFRIAINHLKTYKKGMFSQHPLSFEFYGKDILEGKTSGLEDLSKGVDRGLLEEELKLSCTNVMLQCLDGESRAIFILGTMFKADSKVAGDILGLSPEAYRQRLSRIRKKVAEFLSVYCGLSGTGSCNCRKRIDYAIMTRRLNPDHLEYSALQPSDEQLHAYVDAMEQIDDLSFVFQNLPAYRPTQTMREYLLNFLNSDAFKTVRDTQGV